MKSVLTVIILILLTAAALEAQTTDLTYQGQLQTSSSVANGSFDFEFALYDSLAGGSQLGSTIARTGVAVSNGIFSVNLDFGNLFPGAGRFLEIRVRSGGGAFTTLSPRQPLSSTPYAVKSINAESSTVAVNAITANIATNAQNAVTFSGTLGGDVTGTQSSTTVARLRGRDVAATQPNNGQVLKFITATGQWEPATDETGSGGGGTITGVTAGTGLTGGGTSGTVGLAIANAGVATSQLADGSVTDPKIVTVSGAKVTGAVNNSNQLGGVAANQFVVTTDPRMTDARPPTPGSTSYIQNGGAAQNASFNISGLGTAGNLNSLNNYLINGIRVLSTAGSLNMFVGASSGTANTGSFNAFFGASSGFNNLAGENNSFFGSGSGFANTTGNSNSFFGRSAGEHNTTGAGNTFLGSFNGDSNTTGGSNTFVGWSAGRQNTNGSHNAFFGATAGFSNVGSNNSFFGSQAGQDSTLSTDNSFFGKSAGMANISGVANAFFGAEAGRNSTGAANSYFGSRAGALATTADGNAFFGVNAGDGTTIGGQNTFVGGGNFFEGYVGGTNTTGSRNTILGYSADVGSGNLSYATAIGADAVVSTSNTIVLGRVSDTVRVPGSFASVGQMSTNGNLIVFGTSGLGDRMTITGGGDATLAGGGYIVTGLTTGANLAIDNNEIIARDNGSTSTLFLNTNGGNVNIGTLTNDQRLTVNGNASKVGGGTWAVFSDERLKKVDGRYTLGLDAIRQLNPIRFEYKPDNALGLVNTGKHVGFSAQEVQKVIPEAVTTTSSGYLQLNSDPIIWAMLNAVKEQQKTIETQQAQIDELKKLVCQSNASATICKENK